MGGIFAEINLRTVAVVLVIVILVVNEPAGSLVIMLVNHVYVVVFGQPPSGFVVATFRPWSRSPTNHDVGILFFHGLNDHQVTFLKGFGNQILIADADIFQVEGCGMPLFRAQLAPLRSLGIAVCPFYQVEHVLHVSRHLVHWYAALLPVSSVAGILATYASRQHRKGLATQILAQLEVLIIAQTFGLMVSPNVALRFAGFERADGLFPIVHVVQPVAMRRAATRETHEFGLHVGQRLRQVGAHAVLTSLERVLREQRNHVHGHYACTLRFHFNRCMVGIGIGFQHSSHLFPIGLWSFHRSLRHDLPVLHKAHLDFSAFALQLLGKHGEVVFLPFAEHDAVKTSVRQRHVARLLHVQSRVMGIVLVDGRIRPHFPRASIAFQCP